MENTSTAAATNELQLVHGSMELIQSLPDKLAKHESSLANAKAAVQQQIDKIGANGNQLNEQLDNETKELIIKVKKTLTIREDDRKPITQLFTAISKKFTGVENELKALVEPLQQYRDSYAKWLHEEAERKRKEAERKAAIANAKSELAVWITEKITTQLNDHLHAKKEKMLASFNAVTLADYDEKLQKLSTLVLAFNRNKLAEVVNYAASMPQPALLTVEDLTQVRNDTQSSYDFDSWIATHDAAMEDLRKELLDKMPSKKIELEEAAAAERKRIEAEEAARKAEQDRQAAIAAANAAEKERLEAEAAKQRQEEAKRLADMKAEEERLAKERADREAEEARRLADEKAEADKKAKADAELAAASAKAATLFTQAIDSTPDAAAIESRSSYNIVVKHQAGWAEVFQLWYQQEGIKLSIEDMGKKSLNQMKAFCEKHAKATGEKIASKYLSYEVAVTAVNRK